jgi:hypothetical protein
MMEAARISETLVLLPDYTAPQPRIQPFSYPQQMKTSKPTKKKKKKK